ncbi:MAG: glycosyltransferase family 2 protein, partial [Verrucomicrobiota bacterium]|nr:glycosyltransferase family 2 protein [Verrucomicrobiota bacterium]
MSQQGLSESIEISVVMPCLNEAETLKLCISKALSCLRENKVTGEVVVADNGSIDSSKQIAESAGARVVLAKSKGYGNALIEGISAARGKYIIMGDADDSYDFSSLMVFIDKLRDGSDLVMGNRFRGGIAPGAM